ncbi:MAG: glycosyltransferase family 2 protein, partial [Nitrososphaerales archaeon]
MKKCCVIIPYYNAGASLLDSINSIDYDSVAPEVIVVDDGSTNQKAETILNLYDGPLTVRLIQFDKNYGIEHALN